MTALDLEYVVARTVLLDALDALADHRQALVVVGAQAVYLRTEPMEGYQPFTTDADVVVEPAALAPRPGLEQAMRGAGFHLKGEDTGRPAPGVWETEVAVAGRRDDLVIPVDLIVPDAVAPRVGRRGVRLGGEHGKRAARRAVGLEGALVESAALEITALAEGDQRRIVVNVAGPGALLVSKLHKIADRSGQPDRLTDKDAGDMVRLMLSLSAESTVERLIDLLGDQRSAEVTHQAIDLLESLFGTPRGVGTQMAIRALTGVTERKTVIEVCTGFTVDVLDRLRGVGIP